MNSQEYRRMQFENLICRANGNEFQRLFYRIMKETTEDDLFQEIRPSGNDGDKKCDGYIRSKGIFYQVYGPDNPEKNETIKYSESKLVTDFEGLYENVFTHKFFEPILEFHYVINDKFTGALITPNLDSKMNELRNAYKAIKFGYISSQDLLNKCMLVDEITQKTILNTYLGIELTGNVIYEIIDKIVVHLSKTVSQYNFSDELLVPDFQEKITFNKLNDRIADALKRSGSYISDVETALDSYPDSFKDDLKNIYVQLYNDAKNAYPEKPNSQFTYILEKSIPENTEDQSSKNEYTSNVLLLMSKFFESCDIFGKCFKRWRSEKPIQLV